MGSIRCPRCSSKRVECVDKPGVHEHRCFDCGHTAKFTATR